MRLLMSPSKLFSFWKWFSRVAELYIVTNKFFWQPEAQTGQNMYVEMKYDC